MSEQKQSTKRAGKYQAGGKSSAGHGAVTFGKVAVILLLVLFAAVFAYTAYGVFLQDTIYSGVHMGTVDLSGMDRAEARAALDAAYGGSQIENVIDIRVGEQFFSLAAKDAGLQYDIPRSIDRAFQFGRQDSVLNRAKYFWSTRLHPAQLELVTALDGDVLRAQVEEIAEQVVRPLAPSAWSYENGTLTLDKGQSGFALDTAGLLETLETKLKTADFTPAEGMLTSSEPEVLRADAILAAVSKTVVQPTLDIVNDPTGNTVLPGEDGVIVDEGALARALVSDRRVETVPCEIVKPTCTAAEYKAMLFRDELGRCRTSFNPNNEGRTTNVLLATDFCNGIILMPGQEFSYNKAVGPRTKERGFRDAIVYVGDKAEDGLGGGICQVSSTIYSAALRADLQITERANHSRMVTYVPLGEDATVVWGARDFRFVNNTPFPLKLVTSHRTRDLTVQIFGTALENKTVEIETVQLSKTPFEIQKVINPELPVGTEKVKANGYTGYKTESYRVVYIDGREVSRTLENKSTYRKYDKIIEYNPGPGGTGTGTGGTTPVGPSLPEVSPEPLPPADPNAGASQLTPVNP